MIVVSRTHQEDAAPPSLDRALPGVLGTIQSHGREPWTVMAWTHREVHAVECIPEEVDTDSWVADALADATRDPVRQLLIAVNLAPGLAHGWGFDAWGHVYERAIVFGQPAIGVQLGGDPIIDHLMHSARLIWGAAWSPLPQEDTE